jgi:hypothetical protein
MAEDRRQELIAEYAEVNQNFRLYADIRFKLLALVPTLGGVGVYALSRAESADADFALGLVIGVLGFLATLGITFYDQRNSELYNALSDRASYLEKQLKLPHTKGERAEDASGELPKPVGEQGENAFGGQWQERPGRGRYLLRFINMGHDSGLALIYGPVIGAWFYPIVLSVCRLVGITDEVASLAGLFAAGIATSLFVVEFLRLDGVFRTLPRNRKQKKIRRALQEAVRENPRLKAMPAKKVASQLVLEDRLKEEPTPALVHKALKELG